MNIKVTGNCTVVVEAENVHIEDDISIVKYSKREDGTTDFSKRIGPDIPDEEMDKYASLFSDIVYNRNSPYDSSYLIKQLFEKLPVDVMEETMTEVKTICENHIE